MIQYLPIREAHYSDDLGRYISFGIKAVDSRNNVILFISDVSVNESLVNSICIDCTKGELNPIHLLDVIEDRI